MAKKRGRKRLINGEKKKLIQVFVKAKHHVLAKKKIQKIAGELNSTKNNPSL